MELKVWVDGVQRVVCGVSEATTCQDVVYALAHATGRTGRFTLVERWRNNERLLAPQEHPAKVLMKWGEYSGDVQFILLRSPLEKSAPRSRRLGTGGGVERPVVDAGATTVLSPELERRRSDLRLLEHVKRGTVGVVRPQRPPEPAHQPPSSALDDSVSSSDVSVEKVMRGSRLLPASPGPPPPPFCTPPPYREPPAPPGPAGRGAASPSSAPAPRLPPPYRDPPPPPPPASQPLSPSSLSSHAGSGSESAGTPSPPVPRPDKSGVDAYSMQGTAAYNGQYRHLLTVVNRQKRQLNALQADVTKYDAEIGQLEASLRQQDGRMAVVRSEAGQLQLLLEQRDRELSELEPADQLRREAEAGERLRAEGEQLKSKLAACETDLATYSDKIRELSAALEAERGRERESDERTAAVAADELQQLADQLRQLQLTAAGSERQRHSLETEIAELGSELAQRQARVEQLLHQLRAANMDSLRLTGAEELAKVTDGGGRTGLQRQLVGSPRQLENAVPTSRNPHGVWV